MDKPIEEPKSVFFNHLDGKINCNFQPNFKINFTPIKNGDFKQFCRPNPAPLINSGFCYICTESTCLDFKFRAERSHDEDIQCISALNSGIRVRINTDCSLKGVGLKNIKYDSNIISFNLLFVIFNLVYNQEQDVSYNITVNLQTSECRINNSSHKLLTALELTKSEMMNKSSFNNELLFKQTSKLSNYYECPVFYDNRWYKSSESAYQSMKTMDKSLRDKFSNLNPDDAKQLGRKIQDSSSFRSDWFSVQYQIMYEIVKAKFTRNKDCYNELIKTKGKNLVEDTTGWHDQIWGRCNCDSCKGLGRNWLGKILTDLRKEFVGE
jgi:hypothetical protein